MCGRVLCVRLCAPLLLQFRVVLFNPSNGLLLAPTLTSAVVSVLDDGDLSRPASPVPVDPGGHTGGRMLVEATLTPPANVDTGGAALEVRGVGCVCDVARFMRVVLSVVAL